VVLGSATPALESRHNVQRGRYRLLNLPERVGGGGDTARLRSWTCAANRLTEGLSRPLLERIRAHLARDEQVLLFLNRRGFAPVLFCHECGWLSQCRHCDARMTLHLRQQRLICHHCGDNRPVDAACPICGSVDLRRSATAPNVSKQRCAANFRTSASPAWIATAPAGAAVWKLLLADIQAGGRRQLLIGTQMLAKGHHFPDVTLVGIVDADQGLYGIDFRASERMAQLILQVAGRAGRADKPGTVIIQTHHPDHPLLRTLVFQGYPAFRRSGASRTASRTAAALRSSGAAAGRSRRCGTGHRFSKAARALAEPIADGLELLVPAPAPMERRAGRYRAHLLAASRPAAGSAPVSRSLDRRTVGAAPGSSRPLVAGCRSHRLY
jgi:primosomal protein N' (replication factor Y)